MEEDIDLPFVISKKKNYDSIQYKNDFTNIILIFDYEHHDPKFDEEKILKMQRYFTESTDVGKLYINYPMIESYRHLMQIPDDKYEDRKISVSLQPGIQYKQLVKDTIVAKNVDFLCKMKEILEERFNVQDDELCSKSVEELLAISDSRNLREDIEFKLNNVVKQDSINTAKYQFGKWTYMGIKYLRVYNCGVQFFISSKGARKFIKSEYALKIHCLICMPCFVYPSGHISCNK